MLFHVILRSAMFGFCCVCVLSVRVISYSISCRSNLFQVHTIYFMIFRFISCRLLLFHFSAAVGCLGGHHLPASETGQVTSVSTRWRKGSLLIWLACKGQLRLAPLYSDEGGGLLLVFDP